LSANSIDASYYYWGSWYCHRYVVDVWVPATSNGTFALVGGWNARMYVGSCNLLGEDITIYSKTVVSNSFTKIANGHFQGADSVNPNGSLQCAMVQTQGDQLVGHFTGVATDSVICYPCNPDHLGVGYWAKIGSPSLLFPGQMIRVAVVVKWVTTAEPVTVCAVRRNTDDFQAPEVLWGVVDHWLLHRC
jgi:hypothetical protein